MKKQYFESNSGLGYGELNYFVKLCKNTYLCVGHTLHENEPCIELGEIVYTTNNWKNLDDSEKNFILNDEIVSCSNPNITLNENIIDLALNQQQQIQTMKEDIEQLNFMLEQLN